MNFSYIMDLEPKIQKQICHPLQLPALPPSIMPPQKLSAALLSEVAGANSSPRIWSWYVGTAEKISHTDFCLYKNENVFGKRLLFSQKGGWLMLVVLDILLKFSGGYFFSIPCTKRVKFSGKGRHIRWAPGNGRDVGRVGQFTPSDALAKTKAISAYDMWVYRVRLMSVSGSQEIHIGNSFRITHATTNSGLSFNPTSKSFSLSLV